ncbi:PQ loop repeat-containing protein 2 [Cichlidogyrus casuarinus]|uniref:PQ loop repeat-containing protein 2 n=1 Tax=Cichlidogyrus casuarinus TaxID=1844966 RepID=A0ABD2QI67_9PLAT
MPQIIENVKRGIPDEAMSPFLILFWTIGDTLNLTGAILTKQLVLQLVVACISICADLAMGGQFIYYGQKHKRILREEKKALQAQGPIEVEHVSPRHGSFTAPVSLAAFGVGLFTLTSYFNTMQIPPSFRDSNSPIQRQLLAIDDDQLALDYLFPTKLEYVGYVLGWLSTLMYFSSRFPQLYRNWSRKTTDGLSLGLFILACTGNSSYGLQIFLSSSDTRTLIRSLPWILGSMGVLTLDLIILFQFYWYRMPPNEYQLYEDEDGLLHAEPLFGLQTGVEAELAP